MNKKMVTTAALLIALSIVLGAFGAHGLKKIATLERVASFETGVRYQFYSAISILILGLNNEKFKFNLKPIYTLLLVGMSCFSISIYLLSLQDFLFLNYHFHRILQKIDLLLCRLKTFQNLGQMKNCTKSMV